MIRAVVDTNVLVSGFISPLSHPREIERRWRRAEFVLVTSRDIVEEVSRVLHLPRIMRKYHVTEADVEAFVLALVNKSSYVAERLALGGVAPDPGDDKIIACAVAGPADFIVTGDKPLQRVGEFRGIRIIDAGAFIGVLGEK